MQPMLNRERTELLASAFGSAAHPMAQWYAPLLADASLRAFTAAHAAKIRKKVRHAGDAEALRDLQCELAVAAALADRRSPLTYEPLAAIGHRGPDFLLRYKGHTNVYVEVSRLRPARNQAQEPTERLAAVLCGKLDQLVSGAANLLVLISDAGPFTADVIGGTLHALRRRVAANDEAYFAFRGLNGARAFQHCLPRLSGVLLTAPARTDTPPARADATLRHLHLPSHARHALPPDLASSAAGWALAHHLSSVVW
jgi:hypothetical protein